jgi:hypothetical protein
VKLKYFTRGSRRSLALRGAFRSSAIDGAGLSIGRDRSLINIELPECSIWVSSHRVYAAQLPAC